MKIGIDARPIAGRLTGDRTYWRGLISGLGEIDQHNAYTLFLRFPLAEDDRLELPDNFTIKVMPAATERIWSLITFGQGLRQDNFDVAHVQYTLPPFLPCPGVTTVHDISFKLFPELFSSRDRTLLNLTVPDSIRRAKQVITVSESSRRDILNAYEFLKPEKITATPLAASPEFRTVSDAERLMEFKTLGEKYRIDGPYIFSVGVLQPRKNLSMLIRAFTAARQNANLPHRLIIAGKVGWLSEETEREIGNAGDSVSLIGYVPDKDLPILYRCADLTAYPSLYEGFGLPVLESMASGCPVVASCRSSLPEVAGDAGILLEPDNQDIWSENLAALAIDKGRQRSMREKGLIQAARFSWKETARVTRQVYDAAVR